METKTKTQRVNYTEQFAILLTKADRVVLEDLAIILRGTYSQVFRLALTSLAKDLKDEIDEYRRENDKSR